MSLWTNGSSSDLYAGTQPPLPGSNSSSNRTDGSQPRGPHGAAPLDLSRAVPVGMVLASFIMFAIVGNILVILSVVCNRHLRIPTNYFIINLAIADLLLGTTVLPVSATLEDDTVCLITQEPFYALFSSLGSFYIPLAVILAMYCRVYIVAKRTTKNLEAGMMKERQEDSNELTLRIHCRNQQIHDLCSAPKAGGGGASAGRSTLTVKLLKFSREKKAAKTLGVVVGMFILCWLPFFLALPISSFNSSLQPPETFFKVIFWLGYFNSCLNPIIYPCYSREFKQAFIRILRCRWKRKRQGWQAYYNYRCQQGSNNSSFLNGSQQTLSSISPSPRCVTSRLRPPPRSSDAGRDLLPGSAARGRLNPVSPLAKDTGAVLGVGTGRGAVMNGQSVDREEAERTPASKL
ncbi:alpha-1B adrenergic receptor-like isoform X2 [Thunnus maccoyii]|uniref:alpha-1B adrenergic receptor-like isoform X2 n=1 Tax=Thunnus maccoyii TaxID=8240 RepID=UPI001C4B829E|nr:alpha-1B adrenergic receptor-like isoform X2 [Thunnus maccoyii]